MLDKSGHHVPVPLQGRIDMTSDALSIHDSGHPRPTLLGALTVGVVGSLTLVLASSALGVAAATLEWPALWAPTVGLGVLGPVAALFSVAALRRASTAPTTLMADALGIRVTGWLEEPPFQPERLELRGDALVATGSRELVVVEGWEPSDLAWLGAAMAHRVRVPLIAD